MTHLLNAHCPIISKKFNSIAVKYIQIKPKRVKCKQYNRKKFAEMQGTYQYWDDSVSSLFVLLETTVTEARQFS